MDLMTSHLQEAFASGTFSLFTAEKLRRQVQTSSILPAFGGPARRFFSDLTSCDHAAPYIVPAVACVITDSGKLLSNPPGRG